MEYLVVDIETYDPLLQKEGTGVFRKDGKVLGVAFHDSRIGVTSYSPPSDKIRALLATPIPKVFHNAMYDLDWLINGLGWEVNGEWHDTMIREVLLDMWSSSFSLDATAHKYGVVGKLTNLLEDWALENNIKDVYKHLEEVPFPIVSAYAKQDVLVTGQIYELQEQRIAGDPELHTAYKREMKLLKLLLKMRKRGCRVSESRRVFVEGALLEEFNDTLHELNTYFGFELNTSQSSCMVRVWDKLGLPTERTAKGNPSFSAEILELYRENKWVAKIIKTKHIRTMLGNFVKGSLVRYPIDGYLHPNYHQLKSGGNGAITGRISTSSPSIQQFPAKKETGGELIRSCIIPDDGYILGSPDYRQIEYRVLTHYALGEGAQEARDKMVNDKDMSYHKYVQRMLVDFTNDSFWDTDTGYKMTKSLNFAAIYGMRPAGFSRKFHIENAEELYDAYHSAMPFVMPTCDVIEHVIEKRGFVRTIGGRKIIYGGGLKDGVFKAVNYLFQGSASDILKQAMVDIDESGVDDVCNLLLTVHDELPMQFPETKEGYEAFEEACNIMEKAMVLKVPIPVDREVGRDWGNVMDVKKFLTMPKR
jgi:DNA polymerase I-like protein with 3'-5' exonuclease and polymerase domains